MATLKQKKAIENVVENRGNVSKAMLDAGYDPTTAKNPKNLTESKAWKEYMDEHLSDTDLAETHEALLKSTKIEHMVFPLGPVGEDDLNLSGGRPNHSDEEKEWQERTTLTDQEIIEMLGEVNCKVRRIVHGETARHVYYWAADNRARKDALDMAYKLKGTYAPTKSVSLNVEVDESTRAKAKDIIRRLTGTA